MDVELEARILELEAAKSLLHLKRRILALALGKETHEAVSMVPGRCVLETLSGDTADGPEQRDPSEQFGISCFVELPGCHVQQRFRSTGLELPDHPAVELEFGSRILPRAGIVRHTTAGQNADAFLPALDDFCNCLTEGEATLRARKRRQVDVREERHDGNLTLFDQILKRCRESVSQFSVFRIRHVEITVDKFVEEVLSHFAMNRMSELFPAEHRISGAAGHDTERRIAGQ